jgi:cell division protein FtsA
LAYRTNDVAVGLRTPILEAEKIKKKYGCALATMVSDEDTIEVPSVGGRRPRILSRQILADIIQPRAEEICHLVFQEIRRAGYERVLNSGVVFTGGSASLEGLPEVAERIFDMPIRRGVPSGIGGLVDVVASPAYATGVGLVLYGLRSRFNRLLPRDSDGNPLGRVAARVKEWLHAWA